MKTTTGWINSIALLAIFGGLLLWLPPVFAQQPQVSDMLQKYGQTSAPRDFEGTLYCVRCNLSPTPENLAICDKEGHEHFLLMKDGHMHHLYGINKAIADKINSKDLHEKQVKIRGVFYPASNAILVGKVQPAAQ
jgi:hypothetical protein